MRDLPIVKVLQSPRLISAVLVLLVALNMWQLAGTTWLSAELLRPAALPAAAVQASSVSTSGPQYSLQKLLAVPLFGEKPKAPVAAQEVRQDVRTSALKIKVLGLVAGHGEAGVAVLMYSGKTKAYAVGEKLDVPGSVKLLAVYHDHIIIENNRKQEKIELDKKAALKGVSTHTAPMSRLSGSAGDTIRLSDASFTELIGDARDTLQNSPLKLARFLSISPVNEGGVLKGYSVKPGRDPRLFKLIDMQPGDLVLSINGQAVADMTTPEVLKMMEVTSSFELLVERNGTILSKRLDL